MRIFSPGLK